jgi:beta-lactamase superfamily II metal-dependent hydrolase
LATTVPKLLKMNISCSRVVAITDVIAPPPGELFSETNDNSLAILFAYATARVLLIGDAEAKEEEYIAGGSYTRP